jgi:kynurenine formamidase
MDSFKYISLSHWINENTPSYNNSGGFSRYSITSIKNGNSANSEEWKLNNHIGTHIDFPFHFYDNGKKSSDFVTPFLLTKKLALSS